MEFNIQKINEIYVVKVYKDNQLFVEAEFKNLIDLEVFKKSLTESSNPIAPPPTTEELQLEFDIEMDYRLSMQELKLN